MIACDGSGETHHTRLCDRVGYEDQEDAEHRSDLDGEAAWLALKAKDTDTWRTVQYTSIAFETQH